MAKDIQTSMVNCLPSYIRAVHVYFKMKECNWCGSGSKGMSCSHCSGLDITYQVPRCRQTFVALIHFALAQPLATLNVRELDTLKKPIVTRLRLRDAFDSSACEEKFSLFL